MKPRYSHRVGLARYPKPFRSTGIKTLVGRALQIQGIRSRLNLANGQKKHEWKTLHGFRKFFKTQTERVMKSLNVEILMGHDIGLANSYCKPSEHELFEDYLKAVDLLTVNQNKNKRLEKEIDGLNVRYPLSLLVTLLGSSIFCWSDLWLIPFGVDSLINFPHVLYSNNIW